jgi:hypothetical protein
MLWGDVAPRIGAAISSSGALVEQLARFADELAQVLAFSRIEVALQA